MAGDVTVGALQRLSYMPTPSLNRDGGNLIAGQDYFNVLFTGGNISNVTLTNCTITMDSINNTPIGNTTPSTGAFTTLSANSTLAVTGIVTFGAALGYTDTGILETLTSSINGYNQLIIRNTNAGATASSDIIVNNNSSTATTNYGDFGMNSSAFTGTGNLNKAGAVYLTSTTVDLAIGTTTANAIHFVVNTGATDALTIGTTGGITIPAFSTAGFVANSAAGLLSTVGSTGSGNVVLATSPTITSASLVTPALGVATATSINGLTITASTGTLTIAAGKTHVVSNSLTFTGTDGTSFAFPATSDTVVTLTATQTLTNKTFVGVTQSPGNDSTSFATTAYSDQTIVIGASTNVKAHLTAAGTTLSVTADEVTVGLSLGGAAVKLGSYSQSLNIATTGAGAMDTGTAPVSGFVCIYAIWGTNGTSILACNITSSSGRIYSGGHMPTGYTYSALIGVWPTNGSSQLVVGGIIGRTFSWLATFGGATQVLNAGGATTYTSLSLATYCPSNAVAAGLEYTGGTGNVSIASDTAGTGCKFCNINSGWIYARFQIYTAQTLYYLQTGGSAFANLIDYDF